MGSDLKVDPEKTEKNPMSVPSLDDLKELLDLKNNLLPSLLPDDRPSLVHEVTVARAEAKKWFDEVTKSDRDKREMGRKMLELEDEVEQLKKDNKRKSRENKRMERQNSLQSFDIDNLTDMSEVNSSKFEQEKDRNALLKAHLDDLKKRDKKL